MRHPLLAVLLLVGACVNARLLDHVPYVLEQSVAPRHETGAKLRLHNDVAAQIGLPPLAEASLPPGYRELRASTGHGMIAGAEYPLLRIVEANGRVAGELLMYRVDLDARRPGTRWVVRRAPLELTEPEWRTIADRLDSLEVARPIETDTRSVIMDGGALIVEVREGSRYTAYEVNAPRYRTGAEARRGAALEALVDSLGRQVARAR